MVAVGIFVCIWINASAAPAGSSQPEIPKTVLAQRGKLLLREDFSAPIASLQAGRAYKNKSGWRLRSGQWEFTEHAIRGAQLDANEDPLLAAPKASIEFVVTGQTAAFRNVRVYEARPHPDWPQTKTRLAQP